jgi:steroid delta-isomerase-like uncharacterized protein
MNKLDGKVVITGASDRGGTRASILKASDASKAVVRRNTEEVQTRGNFDLFNELFADDFVDHTPQPNMTPNKAGVRKLYGYMREAFPDFHAEIHWQLADGDRVTTYKTYYGTHEGALLGVAPTHRKVHFESVDVMRVRNGKITDHWGVGNLFSLMQQLSVLPITTGANESESKQIDFRLLINGKLVKGAGTLDVINPATGRIFMTAPRADHAQLEQAVAAAKTAFKTWSAQPLQQRATLLIKLAEALEAEQDYFGRLLTQEQGKPLQQALWEIGYSIGALRYFATLDLPIEVLKEDATQKVIRQRKALGVVAAITPWNLPILLMIIKVAPALLAGNTIVVKPAPTTPLTTLKFGELCARILPAGVVNIIVDQNDLGAALTSHADVAKVAFTGSTATGKKVMISAAETLKRLTLELGGNDAAILLEDVDPKEVAPKIFAAATFISGQACIGIKRLYVHDSIYDAVCDELGQLARETVIGDGLEPGTQMGPIQNKAQFDKVKGFLEDARQNGKIIAGGRALEREGYFIEPTIVRDISDNAQLVREEQFGPVLPVLRYSDLNEVILRVNDTEFGLGGSVWSSDPDRAFEVATRINSGTVWVNKHLDTGPDIPHAGAKQSGIGVEQGREGLKEFTQATIINMAK